MKISHTLPRSPLGENVPDSGGRAFFLRNLWSAFCEFMRDKSASTLGSEDCYSIYSQKVRYYPYLSDQEEQRDWLEKVVMRNQ